MAAQDKTTATAKGLQKSYFDVLGLCCSSEVPLVEKILKPLEGVKEVSVIVPTRTVIVVHDSLLISQIQIVKALNQARLEANVRAYGGKDSYKKKWLSPYVIACGVLLALSFLKYFYHPLKWLALGAVAVGIYPIAMKSMVAIRNLRLDINILMIVAVIGTIVLKDYTEAGTIVFLFTIAQWLESRAGHRAKSVMLSLMSMAPQKAVLAENGEVVDVDEVKVSTVLAVKAGEVIPIDGIVVEGKGEVDEKTLTGESYPVAKEKDSTVWAGTINHNGYLSVKTTALAEDCVVAKMAKLVEEAQNRKSRIERFIDKCAKIYTPAVLVIFISILVIPAALHVHNYMSKWFHLALVVLVSACPCALILSTPVVTFCTLSKAAASGLLIKGGDYLEILAKVKVMAFDKTGTITSGEFVVIDFQSLRDDTSLNTLIYWVASIEYKSSHPMANALVDYGRSLSIEPKPENVEEFENFPGEGVHGNIDGQDIYIGNRKIASRAGCETVPTIEGAQGGKTIGYIYSGGTPAGIFTISDASRSGVTEAVKELKKLGIKTAMLTGDSQAVALHTNDQIKQAIEVVHAELLPEDKARIIKEFKSEGVVAMVGDGINDAPALATADIGISMGISGSALAQETGNIILLSNDFRKLPKAVKLARRANRKLVENVVLSITTKGAVLALGFAGHPLVWAAVVADVGTCLLVILNSMLILRGTKNHGGKTSAPRKHGSNGHSNSDIDEHCCSGSKAVKVCELKSKCSSVKCGSNCQSSPPNSGFPSNPTCTDELHGETHCETDKHCCSGSKAVNACELKSKCSSVKCGSNCQPNPPNSGFPSNPTCTDELHGERHCETDKHCCSGSKAVKACELKSKCSSVKCGSNCQPSPPISGFPSNPTCTDELHGETHCETDKQCCSGSKAVKVCELKRKCSSVKCGSNCQSSPPNSGFPSNPTCTDELHGETHCETDKHCCSGSKAENACELKSKCSSVKCGSNCQPNPPNSGFPSNPTCTDELHGERHFETDKHGCSGSKDVKACELKSKCSSVKCGSNCQPSPPNSGFPSNPTCTDELHGETHCDQPSCVENDLESQNEHNYGCLGSHNWISCAEDCCGTGLIEMHDNCAESEKHCKHAASLVESRNLITTDHCHAMECGKEHSKKEGHGSHEAKHCNHAAADSSDESNKFSSPGHCHSSHCDKEHCRKEGDDGIHEVKHCKDPAFPSDESGELRSTGHCHSSHSGKDHFRNEALGRLVGSTSYEYHQHHHVEDRTPPHTIVDIIPACRQEESASTHSCIGPGLKEKEACCSGPGIREKEACCSRPLTIHASKREVSGCCKSYMKECCRGHPQVGPSFRGSCSEISVEQI